MSNITTHILDISRGRPAAGVPVTLAKQAGSEWQPVGAGKTDDDGRLKTLIGSGARLDQGIYRIAFDTKAYFEAQGTQGFYPFVEIVFEVRAPEEHYHVPLLLSPFGYSTYRGS